MLGGGLAPILPPRRAPLPLALAFALALPACVAPPSYSESDSPEWQPGYSTFIRMPDGTRGRVFTTYLPDGSIGRTTGKVGDYTVNCFADSCDIEED
jgi:hypothetical protein